MPFSCACFAPGSAEPGRRNPPWQTQHPGVQKGEVIGCSQHVSKTRVPPKRGQPLAVLARPLLRRIWASFSPVFCRHCDKIEMRPLWISVGAAFALASLRQTAFVRSDAATWPHQATCENARADAPLAVTDKGRFFEAGRRTCPWAQHLFFDEVPAV